MEGEKRESPRRGCHAVLLVFCVFTLALALLEGAGLVYVYTNFDSRITALENVPNAVKLPTTPETPQEGNIPATCSFPYVDNPIL